MKKFILLILFTGITTSLLADHLKGGWIQYEYIASGSTATTSQYSITVNQYLNCNSRPEQVDQVVYLGIFDAGTNQLIKTIAIRHTDSVIANKQTFSPCITSTNLSVCYRIDKYTTTIDLDNNTAGYTMAVQRCCRIAGIVNVSNSSNVGLTYTNTIPGIINGTPYRNDNSPVFAQKDTVVICYNSPFTFDFSAVDIDGDSLVYSFTNGILGGSSGNNGAQPNPPSNPPYTSVPYTNGYNGTDPMGSTVSIDPQTGIISGRAPSQTGDYAVAVVAYEYRNGIQIGATRKEIHITVANCSVSAALLDPEYLSCNSFTNNFSNESTSSSITSYMWDFGVTNITTDTSSQPTPTYTYADTGVYTVKLTVEAGSGCTDSAKTIVKVFPGFTPDFTYTGSCYLNNFNFTDATQTSYGVVDSWSWNFGDLGTLADTSHIADPVYKYTGPATVTISFISTNSKGCIDTTYKQIDVLDRPKITLPFTDTLICSIDTLQLHAVGSGVFSWSPGYNLFNSTSSDPYVYPKDTTVYIVTLTDNGCSNTDSITVNVLDYITVVLPADTTICQTDSITLQPVSEGLQYSWSPATGLSSTTVKYPQAAPNNDITYYVEANLGKCSANASTHIKVVPYPVVVATGDTTLCFGAVTTLHATTDGVYYQWTPAGSMLYANTLNPVAGPQATTVYYISVTDTMGCPKPSLDSVLVTVIPRVQANAGNDTSVVAGQPLQLNATGGASYLWTPATGLSSSTIGDPVATLYTDIDSITYIVRVYSPEGCYADDAITVKIFHTQPEIFVPTGFTPNKDGRNDVEKPILAGIQKLVFFRIYDRWGRLVFSTSEEGKGWDGTLNGQDQASGTYVFTAQAVDYTGKTIERKGTLVLIR